LVSTEGVISRGRLQTVSHVLLNDVFAVIEGELRDDCNYYQQKHNEKPNHCAGALFVVSPDFSGKAALLVGPDFV
jgi:hypothetical protein